MDRLKLLISLLILFSVLNCGKINEKINEKINRQVYERRKEAIEKIDSVLRSKYRDSVSKDMQKELRAIDSIHGGSDSAIIELENKLKKLQKQKSSK